MNFVVKRQLLNELTDMLQQYPDVGFSSGQRDIFGIKEAMGVMCQSLTQTLLMM